MNYFSKFSFLIILMIFSGRSFALEVRSVYLSSCERVVGVIVKVNSSNIFIASLKGVIVKVPRYEIIGISSYPIDKFPVKDLSTSVDQIPIYRVKTLFKGEITELVTGWPIYFSNDRMTFLSTSGEEVNFSRSHIWDIKKLTPQKRYTFKKRRKRRYDLLHPTGLNKCSKKTFGKGSKVIRLAPQQFISDPIHIKRSLDRFRQEITQINMYTRSQGFYPIPEVYKNKTTLGMWTIAGSKHGASKNRTNNFAPILENQFSSGPFGYQHVFLTGADTNTYFVHEEPQSQIFYKFKADYFHMAYFMDPTVILMGNRYRWFDSELAHDEYRINDISFLDIGFDFGHYSLLLQQSSEVQIGYKDVDGFFYDGQLTVPKFGLSYQNSFLKLSFLTGNSSENVQSDESKDVNGSVIGYKLTRFSLDITRLNISYQQNDTWEHAGSYISRSLSIRDGNPINTSILSYKLRYNLGHKYFFDGLFANELVSQDSKKSSFIKIGLSGNLVF